MFIYFQEFFNRSLDLDPENNDGHGETRNGDDDGTTARGVGGPDNGADEETNGGSSGSSEEA